MGIVRAAFPAKDQNNPVPSGADHEATCSEIRCPSTGLSDLRGKRVIPDDPLQRARRERAQPSAAGDAIGLA